MNRIMLSRNTYRCRLCLKVSTEVINIFREDFAKMIKLLTTIQVEQTDDLPKVACISCTRRVKAAMIMRKQIIKSHKTLMEEKVVKKHSSIISNPSNTRIGTAKSSHALLDKNSINVVKIEPVVAAEVIVVDDDSDTEQKEEIIVINSPKPVSTTHADTHNISGEENKKKIQDLTVSLNKKEISIVRVNDSNNTRNTKVPALISTARPQLRRAPRPQPLSSGALIKTRSVQVSRGNTRINFKPVIKQEPPKRQASQPKPSGPKYDPFTPIPCKICQKKIQKTNMKKHLDTHDKKIVTCHLCGKVTNNTSLRSHIFYFHKCKADEYVCDQCGRHFRYRSKFKLHMKKQHGGTKDFECTICGRKFFERKYLTKHIDCHHKKIRLFICDHCGKDFSTKHALKVHLRQHTEIAPYGCDTCGLKFRQNVSLKTHRKHAHAICEEETVFCEVCKKGFASAVALTSHFRLHEKKKCPHCSDIFVRDDYLERHVKDAHGTTELNPETEETESAEIKNVNKDIKDTHEEIELNTEVDKTEAVDVKNVNEDILDMVDNMLNM